MKRLFLFPIIAILGIVIFAQCDKKDDPKPSSTSTTSTTATTATTSTTATTATTSTTATTATTSTTSTTSSSTKTQLLTAKNWKLTASTSTYAGQTFDDYATMDACDKDDLYKFNTGGAGTFDEGATKCNSADPQSSPFTWTFNSSETTLSISDSGFTTTFTIVSLTSTTLKITMTEDIGGGVMVTATMTYTAQ